MVHSGVVSLPSLDERYLTVLTDITHLLLHDATPDQVCEAVFEKLRSVLQLDAYFHYRVTTDGTRLRLTAYRGCPAERLHEIENLEFGQAVCGTVAATQQAMYAPHLPQCTTELTQFVRSLGIKCYYCQPLMENGRLLGTFSFGTRSRVEYSVEERQLIELVCGQVAIATARDVLREQQIKLERVAVAGQMAAKIAHEINNPLEAVTNVLYLLSAKPNGDEETKKLLAIAQEQVERVAHVARQTLGFYRDHRPASAVNLLHATHSAVSVSSFAASKKKVEIAVDMPDDLRVHAVDCELVEILNNLLVNAIHFSPEKEPVKVAAHRRAREVEVFVCDRGPGINPKHTKKLFTPFFTTKKQNGNGLGLWISRELARKVGGDLSFVPSTEGATFRLQLRSA